jgi:hypothetical protein
VWIAQPKLELNNKTLSVPLIHVITLKIKLLSKMVHAINVDLTKLLMLIKIHVLSQTVEIDKLYKLMEHVKNAQNISKKFNTPLNSVKQEEPNALNVLATLNSEETTAYQMESAPLVETSLCQLLMEEVAKDHNAHKLLTEMEVAVTVMITNSGMMKLNQHNARTESAQLDKEF